MRLLRLLLGTQNLSVTLLTNTHISHHDNEWCVMTGILVRRALVFQTISIWLPWISLKSIPLLLYKNYKLVRSTQKHAYTMYQTLGISKVSKARYFENHSSNHATNLINATTRLRCMNIRLTVWMQAQSITH